MTEGSNVVMVRPSLGPSVGQNQSMLSSNVLGQLEELHLIQSSLLPNEYLIFLDGYLQLPSDTKHSDNSWAALLANYGSDTNAPQISPPSLAHFRIGSKDTKTVWFEIQLPPSYPEEDSKNTGDASLPDVRVNGEGLTRHAQERWQHLIQEKSREVADIGGGYPVYQLLSLHLLPLLQEEASDSTSTMTSSPPALTSTSLPTGSKNENIAHHVLLTSHHLVAPSKRRSMHQWASELGLTGFAKLGYPGVIYAQGLQPDIEQFVRDVKAMQWLALRARFVESMPTPSTDAKVGWLAGERDWKEFQKVGEVVEEMKRLGMVSLVVEMGIGSLGAATDPS